MVVKRKYLRLIDLIYEDNRVKKIYDEALSYVSANKRKKYYDPKMMINSLMTLIEEDIPKKTKQILLNGFDDLDNISPYKINIYQKNMSVPIFIYQKNSWINPTLDYNLEIYDRNKFQVVSPFHGNYTIEQPELEELKKIIFEELWPLENDKDDSNKEIKKIISDGQVNIIKLNYNGINKEISVNNLFIYEREKGKNKRNEKLILLLKKMNKIIKKYNLKIDYKR